MFTGIVEEIGNVLSVRGASSGAYLEISAQKILEDAHLGDSIAVNGVCLTISKLKSSSFCADVMPETLSRSNLGTLTSGQKVNLERAIKANGRFGGHFVSGHIDTCTKLIQIKKDSNAIWFVIELKSILTPYVVEKGSICVNGISLTVAKVEGNCIYVSLIPHTVQNTNLQYAKIGDMLNIECDILAKYTEKLLLANAGIDNDAQSFAKGVAVGNAGGCAKNSSGAKSSMKSASSIDLDFLAKNSFI